jgi:triosephosphate isomerase
MNKTVAETLSYLTSLQKQFMCLSHQDVEIILAPPYTALFSASKRIKELGLQVSLAAQNMFFAEEGAYTGEISARMLCEAGCQYVIVGHSERRNSFGESDADVSAKVQNVTKGGLIPILCVGESAKERLEGKTLEVVLRQVKAGFGHKGDFDLSRCVVAYEPVWAIGSGKTPTPHEVEQVHDGIARAFRGELGLPRILYGGSVNEANVAALMKEPHVNGMLIGGASLSAETFFNIVQLGI